MSIKDSDFLSERDSYFCGRSVDVVKPLSFLDTSFGVCVVRMLYRDQALGLTTCDKGSDDGAVGDGRISFKSK